MPLRVSEPAVEREENVQTVSRLQRGGKPPNQLDRNPILILLALLFAAATATYSFVWMYYVRWEPNAEIGLDIKDFSPATGSIEIANVHPGAPAEQAGIRAQDEVVAIDGKSLASSPNLVQTILLHRRPGDAITLTIRRPGQPELLHVTAVFRARADQGSAKEIAEEVIGSYPIVFLIVGLVVLFLRLEDRDAWLLALLCGGFIAASAIPSSTAAMSTSLRTFIFAYRAIFLGMLPFTFYMFFAFFPHRSALDRRLPWLKWLIAAIGVAITLPGIPMGRPHPWAVISRITGDKAARYGTLVYIDSAILLTLGSLCWSAFRTSDNEAKRKFRVILWGTLIGVLPIFLTRLFTNFAGIRVPFWLDFIDVVLLILFPLSFAYAVVKHRVMEIPILLRQSARYVLVRRGFAFLLLLLAVCVNILLGVVLSSMFKMQPALAMSVGGVLGIALAWLAAPRIRRIAERIDRAFFREAYDARMILQEMAQNVRAVTSREQLPPLIKKEFEEALHPSSVAMYLRDSEANLQPAPQTLMPAIREHLPVIPARAFAGNNGFRLKEPIDASEYGDFGAFIPELRPLQPECLVPVPSRSGELLGLIVLGAKLSQEPYSSEDKQLLGSVASQAGLVLESIELAERMAERIDADRRVQQELQIAGSVQRKLLPQQSPPLATLDYAGACVQARTVGGDYYDFLGLEAGRVVFVLADIAGKGISGALLMANLQASLRSMYSAADKDLPQFLRSVNHLFVRNTETTHYATVFFGVYDDLSRQLRYANCGHNPPLLLRSSGDVERLGATAIVLGLFEPWDCSVMEVQLFPGDILTIYSDGITEASNRDEEEFGEERLIALLKRNKGLGASELLHEVLNTVQAFSPGEQGDDLTLIVAICA